MINKGWTRLLLAFTMLVFFALNACLQSSSHPKADMKGSVSSWFINEQGDTIRKINKTEDEWKAALDPIAFYVLREKGTERAFTGALNDNKQKGVYSCAACGLPLFSSKAKFDSGTGWPSFYIPIDKTHVDEEVDNAFGMRRVEVLCHRCGGHLGHVFDDGPDPTGLRYCMNSVSLSFEAQ